MPYEVICRTFDLSLGSFNRWRGRIRRDKALINRPGPKKVEPFDPAVLDVEIRRLGHARKRSAGTTELYQRHRFRVSRRELARLVERVRQDLESDRRAHLRRIEWLMPGVVWAMDGTEYDVGLAGKVYLCNTQDLGSRYKFPPMAGGYPVGEEIAGYLSEKFDRYGAPLVFKRDNEGNMNHNAVNDVLAESFVLPLNNPEYYAPYNGAIEESQRELKRCLRDKLALDLPTPGDHISTYAEAAANDLNHRHRPGLNGKTSCQLFFDSANKPTFSRRERREIYDIIKGEGRKDSIGNESVWKSGKRIGLENCGRILAQSQGLYPGPHQAKVSPNFTPFFVS